VRLTAFTAALVTAAGAAYATVDGMARAHADASRRAEAHAYATVADQVERQEALLESRRGGTAAARRSSDRLSGDIDATLVSLQLRTHGDARATAGRLLLSYRAAERETRRALQGTGDSGRAVRDLEAVRATAVTVLDQRQQAWAAQPVPAFSTADLASALAAGGAAILLVCLLLLRREPPPTNQERELARLTQAAHTDNLTRLGNLRAFHHDLSRAIRARTDAGSTFALMAIDLDGLKQINDTQGHQAGDHYIQQVAAILRRATEGHGTVYRTGGDEFMALLPDRRTWHAISIARVVDELTRKAFGRRAVSIGLTESTGTEARNLLIHQADMALYEAKRTKLSAVAYHDSLSKSTDAVESGPSHYQKTLAAALARAVDAKDAGTRGHSETVAALAAAMGERLGIKGDALERLRLAGLLHDVGKIGVPDALLLKPAALSAEEGRQMKEHVSVGHAILQAAEMPTEAEWVLHHHEWYDGSGYPTGLRGREIPIASRIIAVADAFEAMTGQRPYRECLSGAEALAELDRNAGRQFDGRCVNALAEVIEKIVTADLWTPSSTLDSTLVAGAKSARARLASA